MEVYKYLLGTCKRELRHNSTTYVNYPNSGSDGSALHPLIISSARAQAWCSLLLYPHCPALEHLGHVPPHMPQPRCHLVHIPPVVHQAFRIESLGVIVAIALDARCIQILLRFRMGCHSLPIVCLGVQESPGLNASALVLLRMLSEMSATWCLNAKHCK